MSLRPLVGRSLPLRDVVAAALLTAFTQYEVWTYDGVSAPLVGQAVCFALATLPLGARRAAPLAALTVCAVALTAQAVALGEAPVAGGFLAVLALTYSVAAHSRLPTAMIGLLVLFAALLVEPVVRSEARSVADAVGTLPSSPWCGERDA